MGTSELDAVVARPPTLVPTGGMCERGGALLLETATRVGTIPGKNRVPIIFVH